MPDSSKPKSPSSGNKNNNGNSFAHTSQRLIQRCPVCDKEYSVKVVRVLDVSDSGYLVHFTCEKCYTGVVASIVEMPFGMVGSGLVTDLSADEVVKFHKSRIIQQDDVLEIHQLFKNGKMRF